MAACVEFARVGLSATNGTNTCTPCSAELAAIVGVGRSLDDGDIDAIFRLHVDKVRSARSKQEKYSNWQYILPRLKYPLGVWVCSNSKFGNRQHPPEGAQCKIADLLSDQNRF